MPAHSKAVEKDSIEEDKKISLSAVQIAALLFFFCGIFVFALGLGLNFFGREKSESDLQIIADSQPISSEKIIVHIDGEVIKPGVYDLKSDSRVNEAVAKAGGFTAEADQKNVNLAAKVTDGQKILIPKLGETVKGASTQQSESQVNINTASVSQLDKLPGIGPITADKIISGRPYASVEELLSKKVVSSSVYSKIKDLVSVY